MVLRKRMIFSNAVHIWIPQAAVRMQIPKHAGPTDKSGKNKFSPKKHWFPLDRLSGIKYWVCNTRGSQEPVSFTW
jgi:hypothetical protein